MSKLIKIKDDWYIRADTIEEVLVRNYSYEPLGKDKITWQVIFLLKDWDDYTFIESFENQKDAEACAAEYVEMINEAMAE